MPDLYLRIADQPEDVLSAIAEAMNTRAADPQMRAICASYPEKLPRPGATVVEIGCGNGASSARIIETLAPDTFTGIDPSPGLLELARTRFAGHDGVRFAPGEAVATGLAGASVDIVVAHTVFSHLADPAAALAEAFRVLRPGGMLAVFDGDYATTTVALGEDDPMEAAMVMARRNLVHDPYVMRRLPALLRTTGFDLTGTGAHGYVQTDRPDYMRTLIDRGLAAASRAGAVGDGFVQGISSEADRRIADGTFYGAILFVSLVARKPRSARPAA